MTPVSRRTDELDRRLLETLAAHEGPVGICPRVPRLAALLGVSVSTVQRSLRRLESADLVERIPVYETDDDLEWKRRRHRVSHARRQTSNTYRLTPAPGVTGFGEPAAQTRVSQDFVTPLEGKEPADGGYHGDIDEGDRDLIPTEPIQIAVEPPEALQLDHNPGLSEIMGTLEQGFGHVQVLEYRRDPPLEDPTGYLTARGRRIDLATAKPKDLHQALDQLDRHTCRRANGGSERCTPDQPCGRHTQRRRSP